MSEHGLNLFAKETRSGYGDEHADKAEGGVDCGWRIGPALEFRADENADESEDDGALDEDSGGEQSGCNFFGGHGSPI